MSIPEAHVLNWVQSVLQTTAARFQHLGEALPVDLLAAQPLPGEWSALECMQHLLDIERVFQSRLRAFLAGQDFPAYDPDKQGTKFASPPQMGDLLAAFTPLRAESLSLIAGLSAADLTRRARHAELGPVTLSHLLHEWAGHDLMHTVQAERALMQPFIQGCGPWLKFFTDHVAGG